MAGEYKGYPSRRQYENARARAVGWESYSEWQGTKRKGLWSEISGDEKRLQKLDSEFSRLWAEAEHAPTGKKLTASPQWNAIKKEAGLTPDDAKWRKYPKKMKAK